MSLAIQIFATSAVGILLLSAPLCAGEKACAEGEVCEADVAAMLQIARHERGAHTDELGLCGDLSNGRLDYLAGGVYDASEVSAVACNMAANIFPNGTILASPSKGTEVIHEYPDGTSINENDYYYMWQRDAGLTMQTLLRVAKDQQDPCAKSPNPAYGVFADPCCESLKGPGCNGQLPVGCAAGGLPQVCRYCFLPGSSLDDGSLPVCKKKDTGVESQQANLIQSEGKDGADGEARVGEPRHGGFNASHGLQLLAGSSAQPRNCDVYRNPQEILRLSTEFKESCFDKIVKLADTICRRYDNALRKAKRSERTLKSIQRITARQNELNKFSRIPGLRNTLLQFANALKRLDAVVRRQLKAVTRARQALERSNSTCARSRSARRNVERVYKRVDRNIDALIANANSILDSNGGLKTSCLDAYCPFFQQVDSIIAECRRKIVVPDFNDNIIPDITLPGSVNNILRELGNILDSLAGLLGTRFTLVNGFCAPEVCVPPICAPEICIPRVCLPFGGPCTGGGCTGGGCTGGGCTPRACTPEVSLSFNDLLNGFDHPLISGAFGFFENLFMGVINGALSALGLGSFDSIIDSIFQQIPGLNINLPTIPEPVLNMDFSFFSTNNLSWPILSPLDGNFATISASIPSSCNSDRVACSDKNAGCAGWAAQGFCSQSSQFYTFMAENCCASCSSGPSPAPPLAPRRL